MQAVHFLRFTLPLALWLSPLSAVASPVYPDAVKAAVPSMPCVPTCLLCHLTMAGGIATKPFATDLKSVATSKLGNEDTAALRNALQALALPMNATKDGDVDGRSDYSELSVGEDPNSNVMGAALCETVPLYGCGASIAAAPAKPSSDATAAVAALLTAFAGVLVLRRRRR